MFLKLFPVIEFHTQLAMFLMLVAEELAEEYFITGRKGEVKRIRLDRGLVEFQ